MECYSIDVPDDAPPPPTTTAYPKRAAKARRTRLQILEAAGRRFVAHGYGATSLQAIADEADVAVQTVYAVFGNKRALLQELLDVAIAGDDEQIAVNQREWMQAVFSAPTATERLRAYASAVRAIHERAGDLFGVLEVAASVDPDLVEFAHETDQRRRTGARSVIEGLTTVGALRPGLTVDRAIDVLWLLNGSGVFRQLVRRSGWTPDDYETWLATAMTEQLLAPTDPPRPRRPARPRAPS